MGITDDRGPQSNSWGKNKVMVNQESISELSRRDRDRVHASYLPGGSKNPLRSKRDNLSSICLKLAKRTEGAYPLPSRSTFTWGRAASSLKKASQPSRAQLLEDPGLSS